MRETTDILLSIIVPVYNVEQYIRACIESIFQQGLDERNFEVIIVNDGTKDNSMKVIEDIISQHNNIIVINQENQGLSMARNNGMKQARGEYIAFVDSDDMLIERSLPIILDKAIEDHPDLIIADYIKAHHNEIVKKRFSQDSKVIFKKTTGKQLLLSERPKDNKCYVWRSLYRRSFLIDNNLSFYPGIVFEDVPFTNECYLKAQRCLITSQKMYIYRENNPSSITNTFNIEKAKDLCKTIGLTWELSKQKSICQEVRKSLENYAYASFALLVRLVANSRNIESMKEKKLIIDFLKSSVPDLYFKNTKNQRMISFLYKSCPYMFIKIFRYYITYYEEFIRPRYRSIITKFFINE